jgi:hypothetical protein
MRLPASEVVAPAFPVGDEVMRRRMIAMEYEPL